MDITYFLRSICKKKNPICLYPAVTDPGGPLPLSLFLDQTEALRAEKILLGDRPLLPPLSQGLDPALS